MATLLHPKCRRLYTWWWDCRDSYNNSKWLQKNITDMNAKAKAMIKFIEEDASRAEMCCNKRPDLLKLVEKYFRDHLALAENYNHASENLRQRHQNMSQVLHDQAHKKGLKQLTEGSILDSAAKTDVKSLKKVLDRLFIEKSALAAQNSALISQLKIHTEIIQSLLEKNTSLQTSLYGANSELEGLRAKLKGFKELRQLEEAEEHKMRSVNFEEKYSTFDKKNCQVDESEVILTSDIHERGSGFELWKAEASSFKFGNQISSEQEALLQNKICDLGSVCKSFDETVSNRRSVETEKKRPRVSSLKNEAEALKSQTNYGLVENRSHSHSLLSELQKLQSRIQVIEDTVNNTKKPAVRQEQRNATTRLKPELKKFEDLKPQINENKLEKNRVSCQTSEVKTVDEMKDFPRKLEPKTRKICRENMYATAKANVLRKC